jgi:hypothetical protein
MNLRKLRWALLLYAAFDLFFGGICGGFLPLSPLAAAQFTTVSGTVIDPNGLPYANGTISATLNTSASPTLGGFPYQPPTQPTGLNLAGSFTMGLADNTVLLPAATTWNFQVCSALGTVQPAGGKGPVCFKVNGVTISGASQSLTATLTAAALALSSAGGSSPANTLTSPNTYNVTSYGFTCDGATDNTSALNTLMSTVVTAGGGTLVFPVTTYANRCVFNSAEITLPNNNDTLTDGGGTISSQPPIRLTCAADGPMQMQEAMSVGLTVSQIQNACQLDFQFNATDAKLVSLGLGQLEIDHLTFLDTNTDCAAFILVTNTQPFFHDNSFIGSKASTTGNVVSCTDAIIMGGIAAGPSKTVTGWFQGYAGAVIARNFFNQVKRAVLLQSAVNTVMIRENTVWSQSGYTTGGPFEVNCQSQCPAAGQYAISFFGNNMEVVHYLYGLNFVSITNSTATVADTCSDASDFSTICIKTATNDGGTLVIAGKNAQGSGFIGASNTTINAILGNDPIWGSTIHWNGFINFFRQTNSPSGTALGGGSALWMDTKYMRPLIGWNGQGSKRVATIEELPTTQVSTATDNFTRANAATLGANWTAINSLTSLQILSNTAQTQGTGAFQGNFYSAVTFPSDHWSQCTIGAVTSRSSSYLLCPVRVQSGAESFYTIMVTTDGTTQCTIRRFTAGAGTDIATCTQNLNNLAGRAFQTGDFLTVTAVGSTITAYINGTQVATVTDANFTGGSPGILGFAGTVTDVVFTGWSGGPMDCANGVVTSVVPGLPIICSLAGTSSAFATATTAGTCVQNTTAIAGATTSMVAMASPVSTPGVGAEWSAFVSSAGNVTINECAVAASAGGSIAFNIRLIP